MSPPPPALSVVVPSRNTRQLTLACIGALASARGARPELAGMELVLVDDAGDDGTAEAVAAGWPPVRILRLDRQHGFTRAANLGLAAAAGEVLLLLNSDAEVGADGDGLTALLARFAAEPRLGIAGAALHYPDGTAQWSGGAEPTAAWLFGLASGLPRLLGRLPLYRRLRPAGGVGGGGGGGGGGGESGRGGGRGRSDVAWVTGAAMAIRRAAWEQVGPLDERFRFYAQDLDLCLRARAAGWSVAVVPEFRVLHHHGATIQAAGGRRPGGGRGAQHAELLWTDLLRWAAKQGGAPAARRAARALAAGAG
ncbi:MAG TPA: glycosyltransferase, partial [Thermoanaerobaculia bacterium]|nr:glycosyltransferase [Thermoanaerobaculia bacterium]